MRLRTRVSVALLALALVPLAVVTAALVRVNLTRLERSAKELRLAIADDAARHVRDTLRSAESDLTAIASLIGQADLPIDDRVRMAQARLVGAPFVDQAAIYGPDGALVDTLRQDTAAPRPERPSTLAAADRQAARPGTTTVRDVIRAADGSEFAVMVSAAARADGAGVHSYVWTAVPLGPVAEELATVSRRRFGGRPDLVWLVDHSLTVIAHSDPAWLGRSVRGEGVAADLQGDGDHLALDIAYSADYERSGEGLLGVLLPLPERSWGVVVEQPRDEAYAGVRETWVTALVVGVAFGVAALAVGLLLGGRIAAPILAVARAAREVAAGRFDVRVQVPSKDEVGEMAEAFNTMAGDLQGFEARVVEETRIRADLSRYLSPELVDGIVREELDLGLGGRRQRVTVLFADVVAFTPLAEKHDAERVVAVLNELFTFMTEIVFRHGGIVDKFIGDCVMAVFGLPTARDDDALRAVSAADEMMQWLDAGNVRWAKEIGTELQLGIGINTGEVVAGNVGSERRMEYTVIGDTVNVAARLEGLARPGQVLLTSATAEAVRDDFDTESLGTHELPGRREPLEIFVLTE